MSGIPRRERVTSLALGFAIVGAAAQLRPAITSIAALAPDIGTSTMAWMPHALAIVPPLTFGLTAVVGPALAALLGIRRAIAALLGVLALALALRPWTTLGLLASTVLACGAIMAIGVLLPRWAKASSRPAVATALLTCGISAGAAVGSWTSAILAESVGWQVSLASWSAPAIVALGLVWLAPEADRGPKQQRAPGAQRAMLLSVAAFGLQSAVYFPITTTLPSMLTDGGLDRGSAALVLTIVNLGGIPAALATPLIAVRERRRRMLAVCGSVVLVVSLAVVLLGGPAAALLAAVPLGAAQAVLFALAIALPVQLGASPAETGRLSAVSQAVGYLVGGAVAAVVAIASTEVALAILVACAVGFGVVGYHARDREVARWERA